MEKRASGLIVAGTTAPARPFRCRVCQVRLSQGEYERHVVACQGEHDAQLRELSLRERLPGLFGPDAGDPELEAWARTHDRL